MPNECLTENSLPWRKGLGEGEEVTDILHLHPNSPVKGEEYKVFSFGHSLAFWNPGIFPYHGSHLELGGE